MRYLLFWILTFAPIFGRAQVLFDGYYQILNGKSHIGYVAQKYEFDPKKKIYNSAYLIYTETEKGKTTEGLKASAKDDFTPISYQYTLQDGATYKIIDATFKIDPKKKKDKMLLTVGDGKKSNKLEVSIPPNVFLSTFLQHFMLKKGLKPGVKYVYSAIAEEDGAVYTGEAFIKSVEKAESIDVFRVLNTFKNVQFISLMTPRAEVLSSESILQGIGTRLVDQPTIATAGFAVSSSAMKILFGDTPKGERNILFDLARQNAKAKSKPAEPTKPKEK